MRTSILAVTLLASALLIAGAAAAQTGTPTPGTNDLGISSNDVREEPSNPADDNNFPGDHDGAFWSPKNDPLVLDAWAAGGIVGEDWDNILNRVQHGDNYDDHERTMYPGGTYFGAWWGWWSDTGGGGDLQTDDTTSQAPFVGPPNGAVDDDDDCESSAWDEFTWRGDHPCPEGIQHPAYPDDQMFAFIQPGTHWSFNQFALFQGPIATLTDKKADAATTPDFVYVDGGQGWYVESGRPRWTTDSSALISTSVTSAANPEEIGQTGGITTYDPHTPAGDAADHAVDVDIYTTPHPAVEQAYRTAVWDPPTGPHPDRGDNPDLVHENGPKGWVKHDGAEAYVTAQETANENVETLRTAVEPQVGLAVDMVQDPFFHEPNTADDEYNGWATFDADTSYGGLGGDYYDPGEEQTYPGYQAGERFWMDGQVALNSLPWAIPFYSIGWDSGTQWSPQVPSTSNPVEDAAQEDSSSRGPSIIQVHAHAGTWYDGGPQGDQDTWVGDAPPDPYGNGTVQDPNGYEDEESLTIPSGASGPEFRGTCAVDVEATLYPTSDTDGDGTNDWGAAGVYVMGYWGDANPYSNVWMDAIGSAADPVLDPLRGDPAVGGTASYMFPQDDDRLSRHRTTGPIDVPRWDCAEASHDVGFHLAEYHVILPTGTLDFTFEAVVNGTLTDQSRTSQHGDNQGTPLAGQTITDVDRYGRVLEDGT